ncbi:MAG: hypothetical protein MSC45_08630 [Mobiluncus sp.]|nr:MULTISPECIES: hypothetical protein [Mobiluncus]MCI6585114.1 hypothetical protein [Mobiluncus sp.]
MGQYRMLRSGDILEVRPGESPRVLRGVGMVITGNLLGCVHPYGKSGSEACRRIVERVVASVLGILLVCSLGVLVSYLIVHSFTFGFEWFIDDVPIFYQIIFVAFIAIVTSILHELGHIIFGKSFGVSGSVLWSTFRTNLNHIWVWSIPARFAAICSGLIIDVSCAAFLIVILPDSSQWLSSAVSTIIFRIVWEFNLTRKTDLRWYLCLLFDNPLLMINIEKGKYGLLVRSLGIAYDIALVILWPVLFVLSLIGVMI